MVLTVPAMAIREFKKRVSACGKIGQLHIIRLILLNFEILQGPCGRYFSTWQRSSPVLQRFLEDSAYLHSLGKSKMYFNLVPFRSSIGPGFCILRSFHGPTTRSMMVARIKGRNRNTPFSVLSTDAGLTMLIQRSG